MPSRITVGVDVGGARKGFHAVALKSGMYLAKFSSHNAAEIAQWCRDVDAIVVGVDAPCRWSVDGKARPADRALMKTGISCFPTPTRAAAEAHPKNWFGWMLAGAELFERLERTYPLYDGQSKAGRVCFETFPQATACAIAGKAVSARDKTTVRRRLLRKVGVDISALTNIDLVDAALCAWVAYQFVKCATVAYGEAATGYIVLPRMVNRA